MKKEKAKEIIEKYQLEHINHLQNSIDEKRVTVDIDEGEVLDPEDFSRQTEVGDLVLRLKRQLTVAKNDLKFVQKISLEPNDKVVLGSLVETHDMFFYVSIPTNTFDFEQKKLVGISTKAPIYRAMLNKTQGDSFKVGTKTYTIQKIY